MGKTVGLFPLFLLCTIITALSSSSSAAAAASCQKDQSDALLKFKAAFATDRQASIACADAGTTTTYPKTNSWKEGTDCCARWDGVRCENQTGNVIGLDLSCSWLRGHVHSNSTLFSLKHLRALNLAYNDLQQSLLLPLYASSFSPSMTHLNLSSSNLNGGIPVELSGLSGLVTLDLSFNSGLRLEPSAWAALVQKMTRLREVGLDRVRMASIEPSTAFSGFSPALTTLTLNQCDLKGEFPESVIGLPNLQKLVLSENGELTGDLSNTAWSSKSLLEHLDIRFTKIAGKLPDSIGSLKSLRHLDVGGCRFGGSIPASLGNLTELRFLSLIANDFNGPIPSSLSNLHQLTVFALSENRLTGRIPNVFGRMSKLVGFAARSNSLIGEIPASICSVSGLQVLDLGNNTLSGAIPRCLGGLANLETLDLTRNRLVGRIPTGGRFGSFGNASYEGNPGLCGSPLTKSCGAGRTIRS
ncbi:hypothetical protein DM860_013545 [Cuscuta australis]|uniref:Leucine-rich repeat-containing N-terminal plant-type domain-containing protein n=1 Tax=Cuscuta australis TaxID=267555 RepID=A0A328EE42_9ASTE|nr:hypothetical protein DM860_013545 [Cuscuta australis]